MSKCEKCNGKGSLRDFVPYGGVEPCPYCDGTGQGRPPKYDPREPEDVVMKAPEMEAWKKGDEAILLAEGYSLSGKRVWLVELMCTLNCWYIADRPGCTVEESYFAAFGEKHFRRPDPKPTWTIRILAHPRWSHDWSWAFPKESDMQSRAELEEALNQSQNILFQWGPGLDIWPESRGESILKGLYPAWRDGLIPKREPTVATTVEGIIHWQQIDPANRHAIAISKGHVVTAVLTMLPQAKTNKLKWLTPDTAENVVKRIEAAYGLGPDAEFDVTFANIQITDDTGEIEP
jgi:hypothetical protein